MKRIPTEYRWAAVWGGWITYFAVAETVAVRSRAPEAPLSYFLRHAMGISRSPWHKRAGQIVSGSVIVWFVQHLVEIERSNS